MNAITEKLQRSWQLFKRSVLVIRENPKLLVFPVVTGVLITAIALFFLAPVGLLLYSYLASIASRVYLCALYLYASEGVVPGAFDASLMNTGWKFKKIAS